MIPEDLGIGSQSGVLLVVTAVFLYWLVRYAGGLKREVKTNRQSLEDDMRELEEVAAKLEKDIDDLYGRLDGKVDQVQLELKLEELQKKRAEVINSAMELKKRAQASIEIIAIFTLLLLSIIVGFMYAYTAISDSMKYKADVALDRISVVAEKLYVEGPGASATVFVDLPSGIDSSSSYIGNSTGGRGRYLSLNVSGSETFRLLGARVDGSWPNTTGGKVRPGFGAFNLTVNTSGCVIIQSR